MNLDADPARRDCHELGAIDQAPWSRSVNLSVKDVLTRQPLATEPPYRRAASA